MEGEHLHRIAPPLHRRAGGGDLHSRQPHQRSAGGVLAGNPLRIVERHRSRGRGDGQVGAEEVRRRARGVDAENDGRRVDGEGGEKCDEDYSDATHLTSVARCN